MPAQRIFVREIAFCQSLADQRHRRRGRAIRRVEEATANEWNSHHGKVSWTHRNVICGIGRSFLERWVTRYLKREADAAIHNWQWTRNGRILHAGLGLKTPHQFV